MCVQAIPLQQNAWPLPKEGRKEEGRKDDHRRGERKENIREGKEEKGQKGKYKEKGYQVVSASLLFYIRAKVAWQIVRDG